MKTKEIIVKGHSFNVWSDFNRRATFAKDENGESKMLRGSGYLSNEITIRRRIKLCFNL